MYTTDEMFEDSSEWHSFHDVCVSALSQEDAQKAELPKDMVRGCFEHLPERIRNIAHSWGLSDTVFRDEAYEWMRTQGISEEGSC